MWGPGGVRKIYWRRQNSNATKNVCFCIHESLQNYEAKRHVEEQTSPKQADGRVTRHSSAAKTRGLNAQLMSCKFLHNYTANLEEIYANQSFYFLFAGNYHKYSQCSCVCLLFLFLCIFIAFCVLSCTFVGTGVFSQSLLSQPFTLY